MDDVPRTADVRRLRVERIVDTEIAPRLAAHLGGAEVDHIDENGIVHVTFTGACTRCAYRKNTILGAIYPRLREIEGVSGVAAAGVAVSVAEQRRFAERLDRYERRDPAS